MNVFRQLRGCAAALIMLLGASCSPVYADTFSLKASNGGKLIANPDGTIDPRYEFGNKPPVGATLDCNMAGFPSLTGLVTGTPFSSSARAKFSGTGAATAVLGVTATGTNAGKWLISGDNLTHDGTVTGAGSLFLTGTTNPGGLVRNCSTLSWSYVAPPSTDTTAPTKVTGLTQTGSAVGTITLTADASSDACTGTPCTGVASYNIKRNGTTVDTLTGSLGLQTPLTLTNVGASTGTNTCTVSGTGATLVAAGTGIQGTTDGAVICAAPIAGTYTSVSAEVVSVSNAGATSFNKAGVFIGASNDPTAAAIDAYVMRTEADVYYLQISVRTGTGAGRINTTVAIPAPPLAIQIERTGSSFQVNSSTNSGATWTSALVSQTISLPATALGGIVATSTKVGTSTTAVFANVNVNNVAKISKTVTAASPGTYTVTAVDNSANESVAFTGITGTPGAPPASAAIKWRPGHYVWVDTVKSSSATILNHMAFFDTLASEPTVQGILAAFYWGDLEAAHGVYGYDRTGTATNGNTLVTGISTASLVVGMPVAGVSIDYGTTISSINAGASTITLSRPARAGGTGNLVFGGYAIIEQYAAKAESINKHVMIRVYDRVFGGISPSNLNTGYYFPLYLKTGPYEGYYSNAAGADLNTLVRLWEPNNMTAFIELGQAYGARFNSRRGVETWGSEETSISFGDCGLGAACNTSNYTDAKYLNQWARWIPAMRAAWPNTGIRWQVNFVISAYASVGQLVETSRLNAVGIGGPDTFPTTVSTGRSPLDWGDEHYLNKDGTAGLPNTTYLGKMPMTAESQQYTLSYGVKPSGQGGFGWTLADVQAGGIARGATYFVWYNSSVNYTQWNPTILNFVRSIGGAVYSTTCPTSYTGGCNTTP